MTQTAFRHWTMQEDERLREMARDRVFISEIAAELRRSVSAVEFRLKSLDRSKSLSTRRHWTAQEDVVMRTFMDKGKEAAEIAADLHRTPQAIYARLQRLYRRRLTNSKH
ncbi:hypothetical protein [Bradyrhizobium sp. AUGA SZCCT0182]|jgi:IS30 family transposase|uniref:hypothetical protein n=1 Tax=Bradyrhizobium sp. AUGA SZCCT0182 TaxID=2807667 RepID=UPI001BAA0EF4|nr:hypothetical protein [Bradyrhizobium sp. AUGA SZCCT0182]MBR1237368.1 hypothetical protein [Bradyrhizobium sp. AUGA SZCCT0182]